MRIDKSRIIEVLTINKTETELMEFSNKSLLNTEVYLHSTSP